MGSEVQGLPSSSGFHVRLQNALMLCIYEKCAGFVKPNPKFGDKLAIT